MRIVILTSSRRGTASFCLPALMQQEGLEVACIVHVLGHYQTRLRRARKIVKKVLRIGPIGAVNGVRMRSWYRWRSPPEDLYVLAQRYGVRLVTSPFTNCGETKSLLKEANADLGVSLGNAYIAPSVFYIPRFGMINVHGELLPDYRGAASVIWPIYEGRRETGFTIHQMDEGIDTGKILYQERYPILVRPTLEETVRVTNEETIRRLPSALADVVARHADYLRQARPQAGGRAYTTPTLWQFLRMVRQHRKLWREELSAERRS